MISAHVTGYDSWSACARQFAAAHVAPDEITWTTDESTDLFGSSIAEPIATATLPAQFNVPRKFVELARKACLHCAPSRFALLYRVLFRTIHENRNLLEIRTDSDVHELNAMAHAVERDIYKMHALVRFRRVGENGTSRYVAFHRPDHAIEREAVAFFAERFSSMNWSIFTPRESIHWDGNELQFGPGRAAALPDDSVEEMWRTYYRNTYNPARINERKLKACLPVRHWATLPEAQEIPGLLEATPERVRQMLREIPRSASDYFPETITLESLRQAAETCRACDLWRNAKHLIFGSGPADAEMALIGEQPGDNEDLTGKPFVGPSGQLLDEALAEAGIQRQRVYISGAVKHFKHDVRHGKRLHRTPNNAEVAACRGWLHQELKIVKPKVLVLMGVTAAKSILGRQITLQEERGKWLESPFCHNTIITCHPAAVLRTFSQQERERSYKTIVMELTMAARKLTTTR